MGAASRLLPAMSLIHYDASLILHWGDETAVGIVRVEHYIVDHLFKTAYRPLNFVRFDPAAGGFRDATAQETRAVLRIVAVAHGRTPEAEPEPAEAPPPVSEPVPSVGARLARFAEAVARTPRSQAPQALRAWLGHALPSNALAVRALRVGLYIGALSANTVIRGARLAVRRGPPPPAPEPAPPAPSRAVEWNHGDVLVCAANGWDYLDYDQLAAVVALGVRLVSVCYDVIVVEHPEVAAVPPDRLHRYFVEMAHLSETVLTVSETSREAFQRVICAPNDIDCRVVAGRVPNLLFAHAEAIGEVETAELAGRPFAVFCATIEVRKNHMLLLRVWERLAERLAPEDLPILVFVGKWGWRVDEVRFFAEHGRRLRGKLRIYNKASDAELIWLYRNARFALFPSFYEGLGNIEPLTFGTPMITSDHASMLEATEGLMPALDPLDAPAWTEEIERLIREPARLEVLRATARDRFANLGPATFGDALTAAVTGAARG